MHASNSKTVVRGKVLFGSLFSALALLLAAASAGSAQEVDGDFEGETQYADKEGNARDIKEPTSKERKKVDDLFTVGKASSKEEEQVFEDVAHYYVNALTLKKNISVLAEKRKELKTKYLGRAGQKNRAVTDLHTRLNQLTLTTCRQVGEDPKYPRAVRYNCMLMISELDSEEYQPGTSNSTVPWQTATTALLEIAGNEKQYVALRLGAVIGLRRHVSFGIAPSLQPQLVETLLGVLGTPLGDESNQGQIWLRLAAAEVLREDKKQPPLPVDQGKFAAALAARIDDEQMPTWARAKLAGELGRLNGNSLPAGQVPGAARSLAGLMLAICQVSPFAAEAEADAKKDKQEDAAKKGTEKKPGAKKPDKKGTENKGDGKKDDKKDDKPEAATNAAAAEPPSPTVQKINAEEMIWQLSQIRLALFGKEAPIAKEKGPDAALGLRSAAADDASKTMIDKIVKHIDEIVPLLAEVPNPKDGTKLADNLRTTNEDLEGMLAAAAPQQEEAAPAAKPLAGRARPPAGNTPAEASTTGN
ncbi:MAG TPA: hypothetical protein VG125_29065 [Pirellulales bacterium]|jgi:hypothetical protein|nr:hypothetical protein [Pirellulales bacterium]